MDFINLSLIVMAFALLFLGVHVAFALAMVGFIGCLVIGGIVPALNVLGIVPFGNLLMYSLTVIPLFIFMGNLAYHAGFGSTIFRVAHSWLGGLTGGLAC